MKYHAGINTNTDDWLNLHRNENLFIDNNVIKEILINAVNAVSVIKYPDSNHSELRQKLSALHQVSPDNIFVGNGADEVLSSLFLLFRKKFDEVKLPRICFKMYDTFAAKYEFKVKQFNNFPTVYRETVLANSGFIVIDSPASITGEAMDKEIFLQLSSNKGNIVIWDNVHGDFCHDVIQGVMDNLIVVRHFSHYYGLAGLRIGYCIASKEIVEELNFYREPFSVNSIAQIAAIGCLNQHEYFDSVGKEIRLSKTIFENHLRSLNFEISNSVVNFLLVKHERLKSELLHQKLADKKIATRHYSDDSILKDYLRIAIPPKKNMEKVVAYLSEIVTRRVQTT